MVRLHVVFGFPLFLFPSVVHLRATFVMSLVFVMLCRSVGDFVWPEYLHYLSQTGVMEAGESVDVFISHSPAF
jgi:hypothetical protein